ncbi:MAG TPA: C39 family peptidase [Acidobacteriaceae bacterium]|nr:C39 family peptidase [Acidobacteriaceae bacterium]
MTSFRIGIAVVLLSASSVVTLAQALNKPAPGEDAGWGKPVASLKDIRNEGVTRQRWDISCGAAALSTLLTYQFRDVTPETDIVVWMLHRTDPALVRARHGFSLLDMKHFAQARGYTAEGFSDMSMDELASQKTAVIVPIRLKGFDHFVVVNGIIQGRVFLADPGFGNVTMKADRFQKLWKNGVVFIVHPPDERMQVAKQISSSAKLIPDETFITRTLGVSTPTNGLY